MDGGGAGDVRGWYTIRDGKVRKDIITSAVCNCPPLKIFRPDMRHVRKYLRLGKKQHTFHLSV
jgi:hypothetical protein